MWVGATRHRALPTRNDPTGSPERCGKTIRGPGGQPQSASPRSCPRPPPGCVLSPDAMHRWPGTGPLARYHRPSQHGARGLGRTAPMAAARNKEVTTQAAWLRTTCSRLRSRGCQTQPSGRLPGGARTAPNLRTECLFSLAARSAEPEVPCQLSGSTATPPAVFVISSLRSMHVSRLPARRARSV